MISSSQLAMGLGFIGLTKKEAINAGISALVRRVFIGQYEEASLYETPASEVKRFLGDKKYRKMLAKSGKLIRDKAPSDIDVVPLFLDLLGENSVAIRTIGESLQDSESGVIEVNDEIVNLAIGEVVGLIRTATKFGLDVSDATPLESATSTEIFGEALKTLSDSINHADIFPDIHDALTLVG